MAVAENLGLDTDRLKRRIAFLEDRATSHLEATATWPDPRRQQLEMACCAGLWRDAAALYLLLEDTARARNLLNRAGSYWADLGLFAGYALLTIANPRPWWDAREAELAAIGRALGLEAGGDSFPPAVRRRKEPPDRDGDGKRWPFLAASAGSTRQLLHLYQSLAAIREAGIGVRRIADLAMGRLKETPGAPVGPTGVPLGSYLRLLDAATHGDFGADLLQRMSGLAIRRADQLEAARTDTHHWRMALRPAEVVDFDLMVIGITALDARQTDAELAAAFGERGSAVELPLRAARDLRRSAPPENIMI